jgi:hypothetical protein
MHAAKDPDEKIVDLIKYLRADRPAWILSPDTGHLWQQHLGAFSRDELMAAAKSFLATSKDYPTVAALRTRILNGTRNSTYVPPVDSYEDDMAARGEFDLADPECREEYDVWSKIPRGTWQYYSQSHTIHLRWVVPGEGNEPTSDRLERIRHASKDRLEVSEPRR